MSKVLKPEYRKPPWVINGRFTAKASDIFNITGSWPVTEKALKREIENIFFEDTKRAAK